MLIDFIAGSKLDYNKIPPIIREVEQAQDAGLDIGYRIIYIGSKKDFSNSALSLSELIQPSLFIEAEGNNNAEISADVLVKYEQILSKDKPHIAMLYGHSTGIMACTVAAAKISDIRIAHIGSGWRNYNRNSGDEINRKIIDAITDYHFPISQTSAENLRNEGVPSDFTFFIGNPIADVLNEIDDDRQPPIWQDLELQAKRYILVNIAHPSLTGSQARLKSLLLTLSKLARNLRVIVPVNNSNSSALDNLSIKVSNIHIANVNHWSGLYYLAKYAKLTITDTETLQDETTILQVPCLTLYKSVITPDSYQSGTNEAGSLKPETLAEIFNKLYNGEWKKGQIPYLWDGKASQRILLAIKKLP